MGMMMMMMMIDDDDDADGDGDDDDLWWWRGVQGFHRLCYADHEERGLHEHDEGCWCQRSPWCRWCWCARRFRQVSGHVHRVENQPVRSAQHPQQLIHTHVIYNFMPRSILPIVDGSDFTNNC